MPRSQDLLAQSRVPEESAGLFIGVRELKDPNLTRVEYAVDDAIDLAHAFSLELGLIAPANVVVALAGEPRKERSRVALAALRAAGATVAGATLFELYHWVAAAGAKTGPNGLYVVTFAGHGFTDQGTNIFCASDTLYRRMVLTGLHLEAVSDDIHEAPARRRLILVDACRNRLTAARALGPDDGRPATAEFLAAFAKVRGMATLYSASRGGYSYDDPAKENGAFSGAVVAGLRGAAPGKGGFITVQSVAGYVHHALVEWVRLNRPVHRDQSLGIYSLYDPPDMADLPLAVDPHPERAEALPPPVEPARPVDLPFGRGLGPPRRRP